MYQYYICKIAKWRLHLHIHTLRKFVIFYDGRNRFAVAFLFELFLPIPPTLLIDRFFLP